MHSLDRIAGWLTAVFAVGLVAVVLGNFDFSLVPGFSPAELLRQTTCGAVWGSLGAIFALWSMWDYARAARRREQSRRRALAGDLSAMPLARSLAQDEEDAAPQAEPLPIAFLWRRRRRANGVIATEQGLIWRRGRKRDVLLPWSEARLFEVWDFTLGHEHETGYTVYGPGKLAMEWLAVRQGRRGWRPDGDISLLEMRQRERALIRLITARTGLFLRTLAPALQRNEPSAAASVAPSGKSAPRRFLLLGRTLLALLVAVPLAEAAGILLVPLSGTPLLDDYAAGTMAAVGLFLLVMEAVALSKPTRDVSAALPSTLALPTVLPSPDGTYRVRWSASRWQRFLGLLAGLALLADVAPIVAAYSGAWSSPNGAPWLPLLHTSVLDTLILIVLLGIIGASVAVFERPGRVVADQDGLSSGRGNEREILSWHDITALRAHVSGGKFESFRVLGSDLDQSAIAWSAAARWDHAQSALGQPEASHALAAIVAKRTGLSWMVVPES